MPPVISTTKGFAGMSMSHGKPLKSSENAAFYLFVALKKQGVTESSHSNVFPVPQKKTSSSYGRRRNKTTHTHCHTPDLVMHDLHLGVTVTKTI
jgi:hypothetical protein